MRTFAALLTLVLAVTAFAQQPPPTVFIPAHYLPDGTFIPGHYEVMYQPSNYSGSVGRYGGSPLYGATVNYQQADQMIAESIRAQQQKSEAQLRYEAQMRERRRIERDTERAIRRSHNETIRAERRALRHSRHMQRVEARDEQK